MNSFVYFKMVNMHTLPAYITFFPLLSRIINGCKTCFVECKKNCAEAHANVSICEFLDEILV